MQYDTVSCENAVKAVQNTSIVFEVTQTTIFDMIHGKTDIKRERARSQVMKEETQA